MRGAGCDAVVLGCTEIPLPGPPFAGRWNSRAKVQYLRAGVTPRVRWASSANGREAHLKIQLALLTATLVASAVHADTQSDFDKRMSYDGLQPVQVKGISLAYKRPGATLAGYKRVRIDPVEVRFSKDWNPTQAGSRIKVSAEQREEIRSGLAKLVYDQFAKVLAAKGRYPMVNESGPDVLRLKIYIVNLYINAPDSASAGPSYSFVMSAGEMTLFMELYDSESGQILARVVDRRQASSGASAAMANRVTNVAQAEDIAAEWARILRDAFDRAHAAKN